jgi:predicted acyltransferase
LIASAWHLVFPINKALWTSSFVLLTAGWGMISLGVVRLIFGDESTDVVSEFFKMWGVNPMFVFFGSGILPRALDMIKISENKSIIDFLYSDFLVQIFSSPKNSSLSFAILNVVFWSIILVYLKRKNLIFKV